MYEVKIPNGAHSSIGKLISKLCYGKKKNKIRSSSKRNFGNNKYEPVNVRDNRDTDDYDDYNTIQGTDDFYLDDTNRDDYNKLNLTPFDKPFKREYILRSSCSRPAPYSRFIILLF